VDPEAGSILTGALSYTHVKVSEVMTPIKDVFCLSSDARLDYKTCSHIYKSGFSRIPVYGKNQDDILGLILVKDLGTSSLPSIFPSLPPSLHLTHSPSLPPSHPPSQSSSTLKTPRPSETC